VGGKVAGIETTSGVRRDAGRGATGETQVAGREARGGSRDVRRGASRGMRGAGGSRRGSPMSRPPGVSGGERNW
jgi:hypothetical protein